MTLKEANQRIDIIDDAVRDAVSYIEANFYDCLRYNDKNHEASVKQSLTLDTIKQALSERDALKARVEKLEKALEDIDQARGDPQAIAFKALAQKET